MSKTVSVNFTENDTVGGVYKASLFKKLFGERKALLEGYPAVKKGLAFPEPSLEFGAHNYSFKTTDVVDKVSGKHGGKEFLARYKKETGKFDISCKQQVLYPGLIGLFKYEERQTGSPCYVVGGNYSTGPFVFDGKFGLATGIMKSSMCFDAKDYVKGLKAACDLKLNLCDLNPTLMKWNLGCAMNHAAGTTTLALGDKSLATLNHTVKINKDTETIIEFVQGLDGKAVAKSPVSLGIGYKYDDEHYLRVRANQLGEVQCALNKKFAPRVTLQMATCVDLNKPEQLAKMPAFGFKVVLK